MTDLASDFLSAALDQDIDFINERVAQKLGWTRTERFTGGVRCGLPPESKGELMSKSKPLPDYLRLISEAWQVSPSLAMDICKAFLNRS